MKFVKYFFSANLFLCFVLLSSGVHLTSCMKEIVHDTTTVTVHDTTTVRDTTTIRDTICHVNEGMVAHYSFTNGSLLDESGNSNDIIFNNAVKTSGRAGTANSAYLFNGANSYMQVANSPTLSPNKAITLVAVFKAKDFYQGTCHGNELIGKGYPDPSQGWYVLRITDPFGHCYDAPDVNKEFIAAGYGDNIPEGSAAGVASDTSYIKKDQWYVAVYTFDGHESRIYVNGQLKTVKLQTTPFTANNHDLFIGKHEDPSFPYLFNGVIDEVRIYNRALCECEIDELNQFDQNITIH